MQLVNYGNNPIRVCSRCGQALAPVAALGVCTRCALLDAVAAEAESHTQTVEVGDLEPVRPSDPCDPSLGRQIGRYKLLEKLGEGGCGVVYVAEQTEPIRRRVAVKVIKPGMDTRAVVARFEAERQALALMDHPNIARVLDAGTTENGRPYFVMELVRGIRITDYCDQANLGTQERLQLFIQVCQAIQHAHQKGIIHRDIKPSNILVTLHDGVPAPKVIDFGIAKAMEGRLTDKTVYTQLHQFVGTPAYMSPEQAEVSGLDVDTRSDIYSLGVLLYELLTGRPPFQPKDLLGSGLDAMRRIIREKEPLRPSACLTALSNEELTTAARRRAVEPPRLVHQIQGDLDWIVLKCLEKDRSRRYDTAHGLAADIQCHLSDEPVLACPPSVAYRMGRLLRRHRAAFAAVVVVTMALLLGFGAAVLGYFQATRAQAREIELRMRAQEEELASRRRAYAAEMAAAFHALADNNLDHVLQLLERQRPRPGEVDLRGIEWRILWRKAHAGEFIDLKASATRVSYSPDGKWIAYSDNTTTVMDARTRRAVAHLPAGCRKPCFSGDSRLLAVGSPENVILWDTQNWRPLRSLSGATEPLHFTFDRKWLVTWGGMGYRVWNTTTWEAVSLAPGTRGSGAGALSPDSQYWVGSGSSNNFSGDRLFVWRIPSLEEEPPLVVGDPVEVGVPNTLVFSQDGQRLVGGDDQGRITVWDFPGRKVLRRWMAHNAEVSQVRVTPDGRWLLSASSDHTVRAWDMASFEPVRRVATHLGEIRCLDVSPDGKEVAVGCNYPPELKLWSLSESQSEPQLPGADIAAAVLDVDHIVGCDSTGEATLWNPNSGSRQPLPIRAAFLMVPVVEGPYKTPVAASRERLALSLGRVDGTVESWDLRTGDRSAIWRAHREAIHALAYSSDGKLLATGCREGVIRFWNPDTRLESGRLSFAGTNLQTLTITTDGRLLAAGGDNAVVVWDIASRAERMRSDCGGTHVTQLNFSPDGRYLAASAFALNEVHVWDVPASKLVAVLKGLRSGAFGVGFSPDGRTLAANGLDVKFWNVPTFLEVGTLTEEEFHPWYQEFSPDGLGIVLGYGRGRKFLSLWRAPPLDEIDRIEAGRP